MAFTLRLSAETRRKFKIFRQNRRGFTSFVILTVLLVLSVFAELYANSKPLLVFYQGALYVGEASQVSRLTLGPDFKVTSQQVIVPNLPTAPSGNGSPYRSTRTCLPSAVRTPTLSAP